MFRRDCLECRREFFVNGGDQHMCDRCLLRHGYGVDDPSAGGEGAPWKYSTVAMQERLGVTGKVDE